jgi:hypothetical protein
MVDIERDKIEELILTANYEPIHPRVLRYRSHYRVYLFGILSVVLFLFGYWIYRLGHYSWEEVLKKPLDLILSVLVLVGMTVFYFKWLSAKLYKSVQVYPNRIVFSLGKHSEEVLFTEIESITPVCWSLFYLKMHSGVKHYFSSSLERVDYVWEGLRRARPELIEQKQFEEFRLKLVQYDHHQKRKEWFFRHKLVDIFYWVVLPITFMGIAYGIQSQDVMIHRPGFYFFRLSMYSLLVMMLTTFVYSMLFKKLVFDKMVEMQKGGSSEKVRDVEFEGMVLQRSKLLQIVTSCFIFMLLLKGDANFYSIARIKEDVKQFSLKKGSPVLVDNRFNCFGCRYQLRDGDYVVFGKGMIGQLMAKEGESVGEVSQDGRGRMIASHNVVEVPDGHVALKASNGQDMVFVKISDIIGKIQN